LQQTDANLQQLIVKIGENNVTITSADIFYGVPGVENAGRFVQSFKLAQALVEEK
jgi:hypothetical protein